MKLRVSGYKKIYNKESVEDKFNLRTFDDNWITMEVCNGHFFFWNGGLFLIGYTDNAQFAFSAVNTVDSYTYDEFYKLLRTGKL